MRQTLLLLFLLGLNAPNAQAVDKLRIEDGRTEAYLPYRIERNYSGTHQPGRPVVGEAVQVYAEGWGETEIPIYVTAFNRFAGEDLPADISIWEYPKRNYFDEIPVPAMIVDFGFYHDLKSGQTALVGGAYRNDSAFAFTIVPGTGRPQFVFLATGKDSTGDGHWRGWPTFVTVVDFDQDGSDEVFLWIEPGRDIHERRLFCIDPNRLTVRWSLPVAACMYRGCLLSCRDSLNPSLFFAAYGSGEGMVDTAFSSNYGYLAKLDRNGRILFRSVVGKFGEPLDIVASPSDTFFYVTSALPFLASTQLADSTRTAYRITKISRSGTVLASAPRPCRETGPWFEDYNGDGRPELYAVSFQGVVSVYDLDLNLLAQSDPSTLRGHIVTLPSWDIYKDAQVLSTTRGLEVYSHDFKKLAFIGADFAKVTPLAYDNQKRLNTFVAAGATSDLVGIIRKRSSVELVSVFYYDYQTYILSALISLAIGLAVMNLYRGRLSRQKQALVTTHNQLIAVHQELEETHAALQQAQATIIAQEKYRQAKDIAGAFAHEIRNALFPADSALTKIAQLKSNPDTDPKRMVALHQSVRTALDRAVNITDEISAYTKLDTLYAPEPVRLREAFDALVKAHGLLLEEAGIKLTIRGSEGTVVVANRIQLNSVLSNLLLNSLHALKSVAAPEVTIAWISCDGNVVLTFADNGLGIPADQLGRIFDAFFSTKPSDGTGLGLATSKKIIEMYHGTITASSQPGVGTTFNLTLPAASDQQTDTVRDKPLTEPL